MGITVFAVFEGLRVVCPSHLLFWLSCTLDALEICSQSVPLLGPRHRTARRVMWVKPRAWYDLYDLKWFKVQGDRLELATAQVAQGYIKLFRLGWVIECVVTNEFHHFTLSGAALTNKKTSRFRAVKSVKDAKLSCDRALVSYVLDWKRNAYDRHFKLMTVFP